MTLTAVLVRTRDTSCICVVSSHYYVATWSLLPYGICLICVFSVVVLRQKLSHYPRTKGPKHSKQRYDYSRYSDPIGSSRGGVKASDTLLMNVNP